MTSVAGRAMIPHVDATTTGVARDSVVGREAELDRIHAFLGRRDELPAGLVLEGQAGAGKTTLWRAGVDAAATSGYLVLACRAAGAEVQLSHGTLTDLLEPHLGSVLATLPKPQQRALEVALLLEDGGGSPPDRRAIAAGALNALRALAREQPVLVAIDDTQWVDQPSAEVLEFAMRRLGTAPVAILASRRLASPTAPSPETAGVRPERGLERPVTQVEVGPLSLGAVQRMLRTRTSLDASRRTLKRIHDTSGGNPFYALELARAVELAPSAEVDAPGTEPLALSIGLNELLADRVIGLDNRTREALFVAAALAQPTLDLVAGALRVDHAAAGSDLAPAVRASIVRLPAGTIEFAHPLLAAAAYNALDPEDRRRWHARIADVVQDPETRARHVALARPGPDAEVAALLADAARTARDRGAPTAAADLFGEALARQPTPDGSDPAAVVARADLVVEAAPILAVTGEPERARALLEEALAAVSAGPLRADLLILYADLMKNDESTIEWRIQLLEDALVNAGDDPRRAARALLDREMLERNRDQVPDAIPIAHRALAKAEESGDEWLQAAAHVRTADLDVVQGFAADPIARFARALELGDRVPVDAENSAKSMLAVCLIRAGRNDEARPLLLSERARAIAEGDEESHCWECLFLAELEWSAGRWDDAAGYAAEGLEVAQQARLRYREAGLQSLVALVEASRGDPAVARAHAGRAIAILEEVDEVAYGNYARQILGFLELSLGNPVLARAQLPTYELGRGIEGSKRLSFVGDTIEAMVLLGEVEGAAGLASELARRGQRLHRPTLTATAARSRALVLGARGDLQAATEAAREAIEIHGSLGLPFERARSLLVLGEVQRRAKQRRAARETLTEALAAFDALGAHLWAAKAEAERARIGGRTTIEGLSETELRVARLVAEGHTNKEVAAELFVSVRAVEANLSKVYAKLGIESRMELARRLSS